MNGHAPIVPVLKSNMKSVRVCGDFKQTINPVSHLDRYPIPKVEGLFTSPSGGREFSKIDFPKVTSKSLLRKSHDSTLRLIHRGDCSVIPNFHLESAQLQESSKG